MPMCSEARNSCFAPDAVYVPHAMQQGTAEQFRAVLQSHGLTHGLLVAAQPYGYDNSAMLQTAGGVGRSLQGHRAGAARCDRARSHGARGSRRGWRRWPRPPHGMREFLEAGAVRLLAQVKEMGWFLLGPLARHDQLVEAAPTIRRAGVRVMVDPLGRPDVARGDV